MKEQIKIVLLMDRTDNSLEVYANNVLMIIYETILGIKKRDLGDLQQYMDGDSYDIMQNGISISTIWNVYDVRERW